MAFCQTVRVSVFAQDAPLEPLEVGGKGQCSCAGYQHSIFVNSPDPGLSQLVGQILFGVSVL